MLVDFYLLLFYYSLFTKIYVTIFWEVKSNSEKWRSEVQTRGGEFVIFLNVSFCKCDLVYADYAIAMVDETEKGKHIAQRISVVKE